MKLSGFVPFFLCLALLLHGNISAQRRTNTQILNKAATRRAAEEQTTFQKLLLYSKEKGWPMMITGGGDHVSRLTGIDPKGFPLYTSVENNIRSAATIRTNLLWPSGSTGLNLSGSSAFLKGKLAVWDEGKVRNTHVELVNRILQKDNATTISNHATHVAGTMIATGVNPLAKGMSFQAQQLIVYDFNNFQSEMLAEAPNLLISNHSYGVIAGWNFNSALARWEFYGQPNTTEDYKFGYYSSDAQLWDSIAYNAPNYLIVKSAGNDRNSNGPAVGQPYWRMDATGNFVNAGNRPVGISSNDGYDILSTYGTAKNILTIGAISPIPGGYTNINDAQIASFSSWGPTDDGRIKPDVVADGVDQLSSYGASDNDYASTSGTSDAAPVAAGSAFLLQEYYAKLHNGSFLRSATLKGIIIHTADEAGSIGPDYQYGWGVINMEKAAAVITSNNTNEIILEDNLANGKTYSFPVTASGVGQLKATLTWTDPKGNVETVNLLNSTNKRLVNDLDIRIKKDNTTFNPWILNPASPSLAASTGDNTIDNVEQVVAPAGVPGANYIIEVSHKGVLQRGSQAYSLIVSGIGGKVYCTSSPSSNAGARIDNVTVGTATFTNVSGCTTYSLNAGIPIPIEPNLSTPFAVRVSSCDATSTAKIVKAFIDYNSDGDFTDPGEEVAVSGVINGANTFTASITPPQGIIIGNQSIMRVIVQQTSDAASVQPCGSYANGETQDYNVKFVAASNDVGITELVDPAATSCANPFQLVTLRIKNFGGTAKLNVPVSVTVKNGATTVSTFSTVCRDTIAPYSEVLFTLQVPFSAVAGTTYTVTSKTGLAGDQNTANDANTSVVVVQAGTSTVTGTAVICGTNTVNLKAVTNTGDVALWYASPTATTVLATGASTTTSTITADKTYYLGVNELGGKVGAANKMLYPNGGYGLFNNSFVRFTTAVPLTIESARLYIGNAGKIKFIVGDISNFNPLTGNYNFTTISSTTIDVYATTPDPQPGTVNVNNPLDTGAIFYLNLPVPTPGNHAIIIQSLNGATIFRNNGIAPSPAIYPFSIPNIISITGNSAANTADTSDATFFQRFYYFLYDMKVKLASCPAVRIPVVATTAVAPVISLVGNTITSTTSTGNQWYLNNVLIAGATGKTYTATQSGLYKVTSSENGCSLTSNEINFASTPVVDVNGTQIALIASPNPNHGKFYVQFEVKGRDKLIISLVNTVGQKVYKSEYPDFTGKFSKQLDAGRISAGLYILKIEHNNKVYIKKLLVD